MIESYKEHSAIEKIKKYKPIFIFSVYKKRKRTIYFRYLKCCKKKKRLLTNTSMVLKSRKNVPLFSYQIEQIRSNDIL
jgi:hypothetical protein